MLYRIKALEWTKNKYWMWVAETVFGPLVIWKQPDSYRWNFNMQPSIACDSIEDGKVRAEAYYRERLLTALEEVPQGPVAAALAEATIEGENEEFLEKFLKGQQVTAVHHESEASHDRPPGSQRP